MSILCKTYNVNFSSATYDNMVSYHVGFAEATHVEVVEAVVDEIAWNNKHLLLDTRKRASTCSVLAKQDK